MEDEDEALELLLSELESHHLHPPPPPSAPPPLPPSSVSAVQSLIDGPDAASFWSLISSRNLPSSSLLPLLSSSMDSPSPLPSLLASRLYLSLLLLPSSPLLSVFSPLPFLSLLSSIRRSLRSDSTSPPPPARNKRRRRDADSSPPSDVHALLLEILDLLHSALACVRLDALPDAARTIGQTVASLLSDGRLSTRCFRILERVVEETDGGDRGRSAAEVMRCLAPLVLSGGAKAPALAFVVGRLVPMGRDCAEVGRAVGYLPRFLASKAPDRAEGRACAVEATLEIVRVMEASERAEFAGYVVKMARGRSQLRMLAVDLVVGLLTSVRDPLGLEREEVAAAEEGDHWGVGCLEALLERCGDAAAGIRARALGNVGQVVEVVGKDPRGRRRLGEIVEARGFVEVIRRRCVDEKAAARKAALGLVPKVMTLVTGAVDDMLLRMLGRACSDPLVSIRKAAMAALSEVFRKFPDEKVIHEWLQSVPHLIADNETSIQEECESLFLELVFNQVERLHNCRKASGGESLESVFPSELLSLLKGMCDGDVDLYVKKISTSLGKKGKVKASVAAALQNVITSSENIWLGNSMPIENWAAPPGAWLLLSNVSMFVPKAISWEFLRHHWDLLDKSVSTENDIDAGRMVLNSVAWASDRVSLLQIISNVSLELPQEPAADLAHDLLKRIEGFNMHLSEVDAHVKALRTLCKRKAHTPEEADTLVSKWVHQLLRKAVKVLDKYLSDFSKPKNIDSYTTPKSGRKKRDVRGAKSLEKVVTAIFTIGSVVLVYPSADTKDIVPLLHTVVTSGFAEGKQKRLARLTVSVKDVAPSLYIQSWVTLGKICLVDDKLAKRYIPLFVQELEKSNCAALRNNILLVMVDFCVRYTALVDCYIPKITQLLRDSCEIVRRQAFILLSRLLQRDYVKWRGVLFLRFLLPLVDDSEKIRNLADFLFGNFLKVKAPLLAYNSFVEAIFVLNDCHAHAGHSESGKSGNHLFCIRGNDERCRAQRMKIYVSLLKQMAPEQLLATSAKLCAEILAAASDGLLNLDDVTAQSVLQDAFSILACKEMRIQSLRVSDTADMEEEGGEGGNALSARGRAVTLVSKKNLIQHAIPIFIELKRLLESKRSPLSGCLMECLCVLLKDYKNEIEDILVADRQLQKELMYDMQKYEAEKAKSTVAEAVSTVKKAVGFRSPNTNAISNSRNVYAKVSEKLGDNGKLSSAVADAAAKATARSVVKDFHKHTSPLHTMTMSIPKVRFSVDVVSKSDKHKVLESVTRKHDFDLEADN